MAGRRSVDVAEGTIEFRQRHFDGTAGVGNVLGAEDDQAAMAAAAFRVARQFDQQHFTVGGLHRFVCSKDMRTCAGTCADNADRPVFLVDLHLLVQ
ncbi:hypothetical protein D3C87_1454230 [compost metagenome]